MLKESLEYYQRNDAKLVEKIDLLLEATKKNTEMLTAIKEMGNSLLVTYPSSVGGSKSNIVLTAEPLRQVWKFLKILQCRLCL